MATGGDATSDALDRPVAVEICQMVVDARGCQGPLDDPQALAAALRAAAVSVGAQQRGGFESQFVPHGVTAVIVLAQSHICVSTWPEHAFAMVDILFCEPQMAPAAAWRSLESFLLPRDVATQYVMRQLGP